MSFQDLGKFMEKSCQDHVGFLLHDLYLNGERIDQKSTKFKQYYMV